LAPHQLLAAAVAVARVLAVAVVADQLWAVARVLAAAVHQPVAVSAQLLNSWGVAALRRVSARLLVSLVVAGRVSAALRPLSVQFLRNYLTRR